MLRLSLALLLVAVDGSSGFLDAQIDPHLLFVEQMPLDVVFTPDCSWQDIEGGLIRIVTEVLI